MEFDSEKIAAYLKENLSIRVSRSRHDHYLHVAIILNGDEIASDSASLDHDHDSGY